MTTKVVDFLNESGGSNFTETAPRPPTYGEENELQSNGGNSTKSSNSHKSHGSSKSHSSNKSGTSLKGDHTHSPASTPRKSNLDVMTGNANPGQGKCEDNETAAPLGFEPEGSAANSPPYSESGTPSHLKWAENLIYLLEDSEGVELFREFMKIEVASGLELLDFWFACRGFKMRTVSKTDSDQVIAGLQKAIYKRYVRSDKVKCISKLVKKEVGEKISNKTVIDPCIFDAAQVEVENSLRNEMYPAFLLSHYYLEYVQNYADSFKSSPSSGSDSARPVSQSGLLPVVHEDKELENEDLNFSFPVPTYSKLSSSVKKTESLVKHNETVTGYTLYPSRRPYYPSHISYAPVSAQDSELQSLSSDALTDDALSIADGSVDGYSHRLATKKPHGKAAWKHFASQNREGKTGLQDKLIPRTQYVPPKDRNLAEADPVKFSEILIEKLNKVVEEMGNAARVEERLHSLTNDEGDKQESEGKVVTSIIKSNASASFIPLASSVEEESAESILDQHCSRIWDSSIHHTPSYSPPRPGSPPNRSPDRHKDVRKKTMCLPASVSNPGVYASRSSHKKRGELVSYDIEDRGVMVSGTETHRHIHHHEHHHHHQSRDSFKKAHMDYESQTYGVSSWRPDNTHNLSTEFAGGDYANRGRTCTRKNTSNMFRKPSENKNTDSGISVMDSVNTAVWNHPTNEKVMKWIVNSGIVQEVSTGVPDADKASSSHKQSHRLNSSATTSQQMKTSSKSKSSGRSTSIERSAGVFAAWAKPVMPDQPIVQDPSMPLLTPPNPTTQLEEAKRRLQSQSKITTTTTSSPMKSRSFMNVPTKDKMRPPACSPYLPTSSHNRSLPATRIGTAHLDAPDVNQSFDSRLSQQIPTSATSTLQPSSNETVIGIFMGTEPIPYRHQLPGRAITLAQIKSLLTKRGPFRFYFKRHSDEFGDITGAVFEEISDNSTIVPMWLGKIVVKVEKVDL